MCTATRPLQEALRRHFIYQKLEIAYAINKPFPFFEGLRDSSFITERMYKESLEACGNLVPLSRVIYHILTKLEKTFDLSLLMTLFSQINLQEYPNLKAILESFRSVGASYGECSRAMPTSTAAPADPGEGSSHQALLPLLQPPPPPSPQPCAPRVGEPGESTQQSKETLAKPPSPAGSVVALPGFIQEVTSDNLIFKINDDDDSTEWLILPPGSMQASNKPTLQMKDKEDSQEMPHTPSPPGPVIRDDSPKPNAPKESQEAPSTHPNKKGKKRKRNVWLTPKRRHPGKKLSRGAASPAPGIQETLQEVDQVTQMKDNSTCNLNVMTRVQEARAECAQMPDPEDSTDNGNKSSLGKSPEERQKRRKKSNCSSSKNRQKQRLPRGAASPAPGIQKKLQELDQVTQRRVNSTCNLNVMTRVQEARAECAQMSDPEEKSEDETMDFHSPILPVTCGEAKGILFKEKMKKGASEKCIQNEKGVWFTPKEFEIEGKRAKSKNWKRSVHCRGKTLQHLLEKKLLLCPPRINPRKEPEILDECEVCCGPGWLLCCATCSRSFHRDCHIPPVEAEAERAPWSCTFCRMKDSSGSHQCPQELESLERQMQPEEQLICEFLLLKAYCHPQSSFFTETPQNIQDYGEPFKEAMWLDLIKERLIRKVYTVTWFVRDMRLIFRNHKAFYKASDFGQVGLDLEAEFERDLKDMLLVHEANEKSFLAPP
ncbi:sp110 nuclear body protein isoform X2 [Choloepus didactylus]|uniref:sp110 nuclear body protein isoform X2 n=1 Tax=Choloepus didactylus TaxID=27675 RepID=UPI00189F4E55|nr:sp110 nuclear body protein isoform X2 [Choloepus didactylus]